MVFILECVGIVVFSLTASSVAAKKELDPFGFAFLGAVTALGGGTLRDILTGSLPVYWLKDPTYLFIAAFGGVLGFFFSRSIIKLSNLFIWADALGLSIFCIIGAKIAFLQGLNPLSSIVCGMITASFGGIMRDMVAGDVPLVLKGEIYVTVAFFGAAVYMGLLYTPIPEVFSVLIAASCAFILRSLAIWRKWTFPLSFL